MAVQNDGELLTEKVTEMINLLDIHDDNLNKLIQEISRLKLSDGSCENTVFYSSTVWIQFIWLNFESFLTKRYFFYQVIVNWLLNYATNMICIQVWFITSAKVMQQICAKFVTAGVSSQISTYTS